MEKSLDWPRSKRIHWKLHGGQVCGQAQYLQGEETKRVQRLLGDKVSTRGCLSRKKETWPEGREIHTQEPETGLTAVAFSKP